MRGKARFDSLQKQLGLSDNNFINENEEKDCIPTIDYTGINCKLKALIKVGDEWLSTTLKEVYKKYNGNKELGEGL